MKRATVMVLAAVLVSGLVATHAGSALAAARRQPAPAGQQPAAAQPAVPGAGDQASRADSALDVATAKVAAQLRCPVCQGVSIQDSPSELAQQMRSLVKDQLREGKTPEQVKAYFVSKYGEWILLEPKPHGFNVLVYALPILVVLGGIGLITVVVRRWTAKPANG